MHPQGRIQKPKAQVKVDLGQAETLQCEKCTNYFRFLKISFRSVFYIVFRGFGVSGDVRYL